MSARVCLDDPGRVRTFDARERELYDRLLQGITQLVNHPQWKVIMKDAALVKDATSKALLDLLAILPPEMRLAGLQPEEVLKSFEPEQRLAGLSDAEQVLALSDTALRGLSAEYIVTLPEDAQRCIRERLGR